MSKTSPEEEAARELNPYTRGVPRESWRRGFLGQVCIAYPGSVSEKFYKEGKQAGAAYRKANDR